MLSSESRSDAQESRARIDCTEVVGAAPFEGHQERLRHHVFGRVVAKPLRRVAKHGTRMTVVQRSKPGRLNCGPLNHLAIGAHICIVRIPNAVAAKSEIAPLARQRAVEAFPA